MHAFKTLLIGSALALGAVSPAFADRITPANTPFTMRGSIFVQQEFFTNNCTVALVGTTDAAGGARITSATFSGPGECSRVTASGLPWSMNSTSASLNQLTIRNFALAHPVLRCGPGTIAGRYSNATGTFAIDADPINRNCYIDATLDTQPRLILANFVQ
ncbi:MAG: hypothetical protein ACREO8_07125 [Luteimonas sp.]